MANQCEEGFTLDQAGVANAGFSDNFSTIEAGFAQASLLAARRLVTAVAAGSCAAPWAYTLPHRRAQSHDDAARVRVRTGEHQLTLCHP